MIAVIGLLGLSLSCIFVAPLALTTGRWQVRLPRIALCSWLLVFLAGLITAAVSLCWCLGLAVSDHDATRVSADRWVDPTIIVVIAWVGLASVGAIAALIVSRAEPLSKSARRTHEELTFLAATAAYRTIEVRGVEAVFIRSDIPLAVCVPGSDRRILITSCLEQSLAPAHLRAVVEHERTHLVQSHGLLAQLAFLNRACLPALFGARRMERATHLLIELIADDAAARSCGAVNTANALLHLGELQHDDGMLLRARRIATHPPHRSVGVPLRARRAWADDLAA